MFLSPTFLKLAPYAIIAMVAIGVFFYVKNLGGNEEQAKISQESVQRFKNYERKKQENNSIDDNALIERYCRWVYGATYDQCVSSYKPVD